MCAACSIHAQKQGQSPEALIACVRQPCHLCRTIAHCAALHAQANRQAVIPLSRAERPLLWAVVRRTLARDKHMLHKAPAAVTSLTYGHQHCRHIDSRGGGTRRPESTGPIATQLCSAAARCAPSPEHSLRQRHAETQAAARANPGLRVRGDHGESGSKRCNCRSDLLLEADAASTKGVAMVRTAS